MSANKFKSLSKVLVSVSGIVILAKVLGFAKNIVMASTFGASIETDLITLANTLVANTEYIITQTLATAFVPIYISVRGESTGVEKKKFVSNAIKLFLIVSVALTGILFLGSPIVSKIIAPTYESELSHQLAFYIRLLSPILIFFVLLSIYKAILNANERYVPGELVSVIGSMLMIGAIIGLAAKIGTDAILLGFWLSVVISTIFLGLLSKKHWTIVRGNPFKDQHILSLLKMVLPLLFGYAMIFINQQVDKIIVSSMADGTVTAMSYGNTVSQLVVTLIASFCMVMYTRLSVNSAQGDHKQNAGFIVKTLSVVFTLLIPITLVTVLSARDIIRTVYERGAFDARATQSASYALAGYGLMFIPYTSKSLFSRYLYSNQNTRKPVKNNVIGILFNIALSLALYKPLGVFGVTFASSLSELLTGVLNIFDSIKINSHINFQLWKKNAKFWFFGTVCAIAAILGFQSIAAGWSSSLVRFLCCTIIGFLAYAIPCYKLILEIVKTAFKK